MNNHFVSGPLLALGVVALSGNVVAAETKVTLCKQCTEGQTISAAQTQALLYPPELVQGTQFVYVVDTVTDQIRYFQVTRDVQESSCSDGGGGTSSDPFIDPCMDVWYTLVSEASPPAAELAGIRDANEEFDKFRQEIQEFDLDELDMGIVPIDSATDLIGPTSGAPNPHDPALMRTALENALSQRVAESWWARRLTEVNQVIEAFLNTLVEVTLPQFITVNFPDGTEIEVKIISGKKDESGNFSGLILEVVAASASGDQLPAIPTTADGFVNFFQNGFSGNSMFIENLSDLFVRGGGRVERDQSGGGCTSTWECFYRQNDKGGFDPVCRVTAPKPELRSC